MSDANNKKRSPLVMAAIVGGVFAIGLGGGWGSYVMLASASSEPVQDMPATEEFVVEETRLREMSVGRITVALRAPGERGRHMMIDSVIEVTTPEALTDDEVAEFLDERRANVRDAFVEYLTQVTEAEIAGSAGLGALRRELLHRARLAFGTDEPQAILIQDLIIQ